VSDAKSKIIIKKVKKISGGGHGGSWKVAYADFVTAMMAFFLLLWLISMVSPEKKAAVSMYFKSFNVFEKSGQSVMNANISVLQHPGETEATLQAKMKGLGETAKKAEDVQNSIKAAVAVKLGDIKDQIIVDVVEGGVRIQLVDKKGMPMFDIGSATPTPLATRILQVIGDQIKDLPNPVSVEGHTDAVAFRSSNRGNWELSTERALAAQKTLETYGMSANRLTRVAGYADTIPFIKEDPEDPRNRRISIILLFPQLSPDTTPTQSTVK
jgi:chemotaxis protein MotB